MNHLKYLTFSFSLSVCILVQVSCTKTSQTAVPLTFVKVIDHDSDFDAVNAFQLSDGNYLAVGYDPKNVRPAIMDKLTSTGTILWEKRLPGTTPYIIKAIKITGNGYVAEGVPTSYNPYNNLYFYQYDNNGNLLSTKICSLTPVTDDYYFPFDMIQLENGNYAFTGSIAAPSAYCRPFLMVTDNAFNVLYFNKFTDSKIPATNCLIAALCESADGTIDITGNFVDNKGTWGAYNTYLLRIQNDTLKKSFTVISNDSVGEIPDCIVPDNNNGVIIASAKWPQNGNGIFVSYYSGFVSYISGSMGIDQFDTGGNFLTWQAFLGYPNSGLMRTIKHTTDGGYMLCGTVNQLDYDFIVSHTQIYVMKFDANLNLQWTNTYNTIYPSYGVDISQTIDGGYLISGYNRSFNNHFAMVLIKTDANGNTN